MLESQPVQMLKSTRIVGPSELELSQTQENVFHTWRHRIINNDTAVIHLCF